MIDQPAYLDLMQRYAFLYGMGLQDRLATQRKDIGAWWALGASPAKRPSATTVEPPPHPEGGFARLPTAVREVIYQVSEETGVPVEKIMGWQKLTKYAEARQECYRRLRAMPWAGGHPSLMQIGVWLHRDHTTVLHGVNKGA